MRPKARVWFIDTSTLLSMAVDRAVETAVFLAIGVDPVRIIDVVHGELTYRATRPETRKLALTAIARLPEHWSTIDTQTLDEDAVGDAQDDVADGRSLRDGYEHWAEATIITLARQAVSRGHVLEIHFVTEDYDARRVAATVPGMHPKSIHRLLHELVQADLMTAWDAQTVSDLLHGSARSHTSTTPEDFTNPSRKGLGRAGRP